MRSMLGRMRGGAFLAATVLAQGLITGCESPRHRELIDDVRAETRFISDDVHERHRDLLLAEGRAIIPVLMAELEREDASGVDDRSADRILLYLDVFRRLRAREAREVVEQVLSRSADWDIQFDSLETLDAIGDDRSSAALRAALRSTDPSVRTHAAELLGRFWCDDAVPDLIPLLEDNYEGPAGQAELSLGRLTGESLGPHPEPWQQWYRAQAGRAPAQQALTRWSR